MFYEYYSGFLRVHLLSICHIAQSYYVYIYIIFRKNLFPFITSISIKKRPSPKIVHGWFDNKISIIVLTSPGPAHKLDFSSEFQPSCNSIPFNEPFKSHVSASPRRILAHTCKL